MDNHGSHITPEFILLARRHNIIPFSFPPHLTHYMQPCDVGVFQARKYWHSKAIQHALETLDFDYTISLFLRDLPEIRISSEEAAANFPVLPPSSRNKPIKPSPSSPHLPSTHPLSPARPSYAAMAADLYQPYRHQPRKFSVLGSRNENQAVRNLRTQLQSRCQRQLRSNPHLHPLSSYQSIISNVVFVTH
jgi:hypothetical protein